MRMTDFHAYRVWQGGYWHKTSLGWHSVTTDDWYEHETLQYPIIVDTEDNTTATIDVRLIIFAAALLVSVGVAFGMVCL